MADEVSMIDGLRAVGVSNVARPIASPIVGYFPAGDVLDTVTATNFQTQSSGLPSISVWQINNGNNAVLASASVNSAANGAKAIVPFDGIPRQAFNLNATESPYKTKDGALLSLVSIDFEYDKTDPAYAGVQIWFTGYHGEPKPQIVAQAAKAPVSFLVQTTKETITITIVAIGANGKPAPFDQAPTVSVVLDGVVSAPPYPSIAQARVILPGQIGWQFAFNVIGGLEGDVIDGYWIYASTSTITPAPPNARWKYYKQPPTNIGSITVQDITSETHNYWVSAVNTTGLESALATVVSSAQTISFWPSITAQGDNDQDISISPVSSTMYYSSGTNYSGSGLYAIEGTKLGNSLVFNECRDRFPMPNFLSGSEGGAYRRYPYTWQQQDAAGNWISDISYPDLGTTQNSFIGFQNVMTGSFIVKKPGIFTFNFLVDDSWILFIGNGAGRIGGKLSGSATSTLGFPTMGSRISGAAEIQEVDRCGVLFPVAGVYPFEIGHGARYTGNTYFQVTYENSWDGVISKSQGDYGRELLPLSYFTNPNSGFDGNETSFCQGDTICSKFATQYWSGWKAIANQPTALTLKVLSSVTPPNVAPYGSGILAYSVDGGANWNQIYNYNLGFYHGNYYDTVNLSPNMDLTKLMVVATSAGVIQNIYEVRIEATL